MTEKDYENLGEEVRIISSEIRNEFLISRLLSIISKCYIAMFLIFI
jgi:hypothetical protein